MNTFPDKVKPCKKGHTGPRRKNGNCIECEKLRGKTPKKLAAAREAAAKRRAAVNADPVLKAAKQQYMREYARSNRAKLSQQSIDLYEKNKVKIRLQRKGITPTQEILDYIDQHDGTCDICGSAPDGKWKELAYDHCHKSGVFRGLLCSACNRGLGFFKDDPEILLNAIAYLKHHSVP